MNEEDKYAITQEQFDLGYFAEVLLADNSFNAIWTAFETNLMQEILATTPSQYDRRETTFSAYHGAREFLNHIASYAHIYKAEMARREQEGQ